MLKLETLSEVLAEKLTNPGAVLETLVTALAKGQHPATEWEALHAAASRDGVLAELAFAYEGALSGRRIKLVSPGNQAEAFLHAAEFFADHFNDPDGAIGYAEKALGAAPTHTGAFALLERVLRAKGDLSRLAQAYLDLAATERERERQLELLRAGTALVDDLEGADALAIELYQRILRLDPTDQAALATLTARFEATGKHRESVRLLEQALSRADGEAALELRRRLIRLYTEEIGEPPRAMPHVEAVLDASPGDESALAAAEALLEHRMMAPRAVTVLATAYAARGMNDQAAAMLTRELKIARGPRKVEVQKRLAVLKQDALGDPAGALELLGPAVTADPADDDLRRRFIELSFALNQPLDAAKLLSRALQAASEPVVRVKIGATLGVVYQRSGDVRRAQTEFEHVLMAETGDDGAALLAASQLVELYAAAGDQKRLADVLEIVVRLEPAQPERLTAARRLARLCDELDEHGRATAAWEVLLDSEWEDEALSRLQGLYERAGQQERLSEILERRAARTGDPEAARGLAFRAAELRAARAKDRAGALEIWTALLANHGPSREAHARILPLLEQEKRWGDVARILAAEVELAPPNERAGVLGRVGQLRATRLDDPAGAVAAFRAALTLDPGEAVSRSTLERLLGVAGVELEAAALLEPVYRGEGRLQELARVLELRAAITPDLESRLDAIEEATSIAQKELGDLEWALVLAGRGLAVVADASPSRIPLWLERVTELSSAAANSTLRAQVLADAYGDRPVDNPEVLALVRATADALATTDEVDRALALYRRALEFEPGSGELLQKVDELLSLQGSPEERLALYRSALEQPCEPSRRRELLHAMARVQRRDLGDIDAAVTTWRAALEVDPRDQVAHQGLVEAFTTRTQWDDLYLELTRALGVAAPERRSPLLTRMAEVELLRGNRDGALTHYETLVASGLLDDARLAAIEELAVEAEASALLRSVLEQRVALASDVDTRADLLERLGSVLATGLEDPEAAVDTWLRAAHLSETEAHDEARARGLYEAILRVDPQHREAAARLFGLYAAAREWAKLPAVFASIVAAATREEDLVSRLAGLEAQALAGGGRREFVELVDMALRFPGLGAAQEQQLCLVKARVLATEPERVDEVAAIHRQVIEAGLEAAPAAAESFARYLSLVPATPARVEDRRWLFEWRAARATDPISVLLPWAAAEEQQHGDPERAIAIYEQVLDREPGRVDALGELARLQAERGDAEAAVASLRALRAESSGDDLVALDARIASLLAEHLDRPEEALEVARGVLEVAPSEAGALDVVRRLLDVPALAARAAGVLEQVAEVAEDPEARAKVLESLLSLAGGGVELAAARRRWFERLLDSREEDPAAALEIALRGAREFPEAERLWTAAERLARRLNQPAPVAEAYAASLSGEIEASLAEDVGRRMVEFHEEWFDEPDRVVELLKRVLVVAPGATWAFDRLKLAFNAAARWDELFSLYDDALGRSAQDEQRVELLREAAMAAKDFAVDAPRAIGYLEQLHWLVPEDGAVEGTLERLYEREGMLRSLIELLTRRLRRTSNGELHGLRRRVAELWVGVGEAVPAFEIVREMCEDPQAGEETYELLERVIQLDTARTSLAPGVKPRRGRPASVRENGARYLRDYYLRVGRVADVARMMEVGLDFARSDRERVALLSEIVELRLQQLDDAAGAFQNVASLVNLEPTVKEHRALLAELAARTGQQVERAALLAAVGREQATVALRAELLREAAAVQVTLLHAPEAAIELFTEVLNLAGDDRELALDAARDLDPLLAEANRPDEYCSVLERRAELERDPAARRAALATTARVAADVLGDLERAIRNFRLQLADEPGDLPALDGLVSVLERAGHYPELIEALGTRARTVSEPARVREDLVRIARLYGETLGARTAAIEAWREVRAQCGPDRESFAALVPLLEAEALWTDLARLVRAEAEAEGDPTRRQDLFRQLGGIHATRTGLPMEAVRAYVAAEDWEAAVAAAARPDLGREVGLEVCQQLLDLAVEQWQPGADRVAGAARAGAWAIEELASRLRSLGRHTEVAELLLRAAALPFEPHRQRELRRDAACVYQDHLADGDRATAILREVCAEDPSDDVAAAAVPRLAKLLEERNLFGEIAELWEAQAQARQAGGDRPAAAALWSRAAELWEKREGNIERAIAGFRAGAGLGGEAALEAVARIHHARGEHRAVAEALEWLCAQSSREALAERTLRLANAYVAAGERGFARARLERAAGIAIDASAVRRRLAELYREDADWAPLAALLTTEAARAPDPRTRLGLLLEAAGLHLRERNRPNDAVPLLEQAVELDPDDPDLRLRLARALELGERLDEASQILRQQIDLYGSRRPKNRALAHFQLARVSLAAGRRAEAIAELGVANRIDPAHPAILQALARIAFEEGQHERAERTYRALLLVVRPAEDREAPSRAEALLDLSEIAAQRGDPVQAAEFVESAFEVALEQPVEAEFLDSALRRRGRQDLLVRSLERRLERAAKPEDAARALADLVMLHGNRAEVGGGPDPELVRQQARTIQESLEREGVTAEEPWSALGRVYDFLGDADAEVRVLERRVASWRQRDQVAPDASPFYRLAEIRLGGAATRTEGLTLLQRALAIRPEPARAVAILRGVLDRDGAVAELIDVLERLAREVGDDLALAHALAARVGLPEPDPRILREATELARRVNDAALERRILERGLEVTLGEVDAAWVRLSLADLVAAAGEVGRAVDLRVDAATLLGGDEGRRELLRAAATRRDELEDPAAAAMLYTRLLATEPGDREAWEPLLAIRRSLGQRDELLALIAQTVPLVEGAQDRSRLRLEQAGIELEHGDDAAAAETLQAVLDDDPAQAKAALLLVEILERAGRGEELVALLERQLDAAKDRGDVEAIVTLGLRIGTLHEQQAAAEAAFDAYRAVLDWDGASRPALEAVARLAQARGDISAQAEALEALLAVVDGAEAIPVAERLLALRGELGDEAARDRALELAFRAAPTHPEFREAWLGRLGERGDHAEIAGVLKRAVELQPGDANLVERLIEAHRAAGDADVALSVLEGVIEAEPSRWALLRQRAALFAELGRTEEALADIERAHAAGQASDDELVAALERARGDAAPERVREIALRLVTLLEARGDLSGARQRLVDLARSDPKDRAALRQLVDVEVRMENWDGATKGLRQLISLEEGEALVTVALQLFDACAQAGRVGDSLGGLERAMKVAPEHPLLLARLRDVYEATGEYRQLARLLEAEAARTPEVADSLALLLRAGALLLETEGEVLEAIRLLESARALSAENLDGVVLMARALGMAERGEEALSLLRDAVDAHRGKRVKGLAGVFVELSRFHLEDGMLTDAMESLQKAFDMDPRNATIAMQLGQLGLEMEEYEVAGKAFRSATMMKPYDPETGEGITPDAKADALYCLAWLAFNEGDARKARILATKALSENPEHELAKTLLAEVGA